MSEHCDESTYALIKPSVDGCVEKVDKLRELFETVIPREGASRTSRYVKAVKRLGKRAKVETLMEQLMQDVFLLINLMGSHSIQIAKAHQTKELCEAITKISNIESPSVPDSEFIIPPLSYLNHGRSPISSTGIEKQYEAEDKNSGKEPVSCTTRRHIC